MGEYVEWGDFFAEAFHLKIREISHLPSAGICNLRKIFNY